MSFQKSSLRLFCVWILGPSPHIASRLSKLKRFMSVYSLVTYFDTPVIVVSSRLIRASLKLLFFSSQAAVQDRLNEQEGVPSVFNPPPSRPLQVNTADHRIYSYVVSRPQPRASYFIAGTPPFFILKVLLLGYVDLCMIGAKGILRI